MLELIATRKSPNIVFSLSKLWLLFFWLTYFRLVVLKKSYIDGPRVIGHLLKPATSKTNKKTTKNPVIFKISKKNYTQIYLFSPVRIHKSGIYEKTQKD